MSWTDADLAYMAGLVDGEGSICIFPSYGNDKKYGWYHRYKPALSLSNTNKDMLDWVVLKFGGTVQTVKRKRDENPKWKTCYAWMRSHRKAAIIIAAIRPYLIAKRKQADLFLEFQMTSIRNYGNKGAPEEVRKYRGKIAAQVIELNRRGKNALAA